MPSLSSHPLFSRVSEALAAHRPVPAERDEPFHEAAVALVLRPSAEGLEALFIRRAIREGDPWSGQIALPGGRRNPDEESLRLTAVRETLEEIGLDLAMEGELLGELSELRPRTPALPPIIVRPFVYAVANRPTFVLSHEVADAFWVPLNDLFDPGRRKEVDIQFPNFRMRRPGISVGEHVIWGMTEHILRTFEELWR